MSLVFEKEQIEAHLKYLQETLGDEEDKQIYKIKPLSYYIGKGIADKIVEDIKAGTFKVNEEVLLDELIKYSNDK